MKNIFFITLFFLSSITLVSCEILEIFLEDDDDEYIFFEEEQIEEEDPCSLSNYEGPKMNKEFEEICQTAFEYKCAGNTNELIPQCAYYKAIKAKYNLPSCPYCN